VVDVSVGGDHSVHLRRVKREIEVALVILASPSLEKAAVKQDLFIVDADEVPGTGDTFNAAVKRDFYHLILSPAGR
jgi:hypothetical protein